MKNETAEQWILLEQSGELGPVRRWLLRRHVAQHPGLLDFQRDLARITRGVRELKDIPELSRQTIAAIRVSADQQELADGTGTSLHQAGGQREPTQQVAETPKPVAAKSTELAWNDSIDTDIKSLDKMLVTASGDIEDTSESSDVESIATELLQLEGSKI